MPDMSYPPEHKTRTHARIVEAASRSFREHGMQATGIDLLMADAGLTRGGFYAHFPSKATLFAEVLGHTFAEARTMLLERGLDKHVGRSWILGATRRYLAPKHRDSPSQGCGIPTLGAEVARAPEEVRGAFGAELRGFLDDLTKHSGTTPETTTALLAMWVGALLMARAVGDSAQSNAILDACKSQIARHFAGGEDGDPTSGEAV